MTYTQEFLVLPREGGLSVYRICQFPKGTPVGHDARHIRVVGESTVIPPAIQMTEHEFENWRQELIKSGRAVTVGPFWTNPDMLKMSAEEIRRGKFTPLKEAFDELLREAERRHQSGDQRMEAVESHHP